jgi:hypothetical protein
MADLLGQTYHSAKVLIAEWQAIGGSTIIPKTADTIDDGADKDGRVQITANMVNAVVDRLTDLVTDFEALGGVKLNAILKVGVNTTTKLR